MSELTPLTDLLNLCVLQPKEERFSLDGRTFVLTEASAGTVATYRDAMFARARMEGGELKSIDAINESDLHLLSMCLFESYQPEPGAPHKRRAVPLVELKSWPHRVTSILVDRVKDLSDLGAEETEEDLLRQRKAIDTKLTSLRKEGGAATREELAKNLPGATTEPSA